MLEAKDLQGLLRLVDSEYSLDELHDFLTGPDEDAQKVSALALAWLGQRQCIPKLVQTLKDDDSTVNAMAEHALWWIWFRLGKPEANKCLCRGAKSLGYGDLPAAVELFDEAIRISPDFAEAYNQRAIAHYLAEEYHASIRDCERTIQLMPQHFGAWAGMGHCYAHLNQLPQAVQAYSKALKINPHMDCVKQTLKELRSQLDDH